MMVGLDSGANASIMSHEAAKKHKINYIKHPNLSVRNINIFLTRRSNFQS